MPERKKQTADARKRPSDAKLPHERDESAGAAGEPRDDIGRKAYADVKRGAQDTDRGPVMDRTYHKVRKGR
jgi:hypothetical protein